MLPETTPTSADAQPALSILLIEDDPQMRQLLLRLVKGKGFEGIVASDGDEGLRLLERHQPDVVLTDLQLPGLSGIDVLKHIKSVDPDKPVFVLTGHGTVDSAIEALREGAYDYITKPFHVDYVGHQLDKSMRAVQMRRELVSLRAALAREQRSGDNTLLGKSLVMRRLIQSINRVARNDVPVLIHGETGTGKELVAREIHQRSDRSEGRFVAINCGAIAENLLESELFGHAKGAFTGASTEKQGLFQAARGGTIFLDEIGETPPALQVKLLRVLQEKEIRPVGSTRPKPIDVRVISATNRDLQSEVAAGDFRQDLYYRLNVFPLEVPALRERREDIPLLALHFLQLCARDYNTSARSFSQEALARLVSHDWPGNVRELSNTVVRAATLTDGETIPLSALPDFLREIRVITNDLESQLPTLKEIERRHIIRVLKHCDGNKKEASEILGIDRSTLYRKCQGYDL